MTIESKIFSLDIWSEVCCEYCNAATRIHFDCPICRTDYAETNIYGELSDEIGTLDGYDKYLECGNCDAKFEPLDYDNLHLCDWKLVEDG